MWDKTTADMLRKEGLTQEQIGRVIGLLAEHRMAADHEGYKRGFEDGFEKRHSSASSVRSHPSGCRCPICGEAREWVVGKWYRRRGGIAVECFCVDADRVWEGIQQPIQIGRMFYSIDGKWVRVDHDFDVVAGPFDSEEAARNG